MLEIEDFLAGFEYMTIEENHGIPSIIYPTCIGVKERTYPEYIIDNSKRDWYTYRFQYTISGSGILEIDGQEYILNENDAFFIFLPSNTRYFPNPNVNKSWRFLYFTFIVTPAIKTLASDCLSATTPTFQLAPSSDVILSLVSIMHRRKSGALYEPLLTSAATLDFLYRLHYHATQDKLKLSVRNQRIIALMQERFATLGGVDSIANHFHISTKHLSREFSKEVGTTPIEYLTKIRIDHSKLLLENTTFTLQEIAEKCGYSNAKYFSKVFHKRENMSPGEYRILNS